ncbi:uncharacterized protein PHACADRAFT_181407 [Phanerochaete carnosa HHB-10118-sp]|uniref:Cytochrome P450 n=1 Tax=Phanerochaete carnosa (strain HHB-10118-sp) TaxID=650164 RepID=K5WJ56_PHACS|nr:uncharacterized protein PHACADRAFT_181407 [Phanerochaete carnosa HHB-10118-sp]EKM59405.1 hypothetical protein PHACADRAFT_181407 [Phanerochaete carnosa HHB-10118-sp]
MLAAVGEPFEFAKQQMTLPFPTWTAGTAISSFVSRNLEDGDGLPDHEDTVKYAAMSLYTGGSDTTASALTSFFLAMTLYPEVQCRAQAELDAVIGTDRLPNFEDRDRLPYINALRYEILRWMPVGPLAVPHRLMEDDVYDGYFLPKGAIVSGISWRILHDPKCYHDPMEFKPERFLASDSKEPELDPSKFAFGYGRRSTIRLLILLCTGSSALCSICLGILVAEATMFITIASTLAMFNIASVVENGRPVLPPFQQTSGIIT